MAITRTITIDPAVYETFGPPSDAAPAITPSQAFSQYELEMGGPSVAAIPPNVKVHLGLLTFSVGPYCGAECSGYVVQNGIAYHALHELAWGYSSYDCRVGSHKSARQCTEWTFLDATTGKVLDMVLPRRAGQPGPGDLGLSRLGRADGSAAPDYAQIVAGKRGYGDGRYGKHDDDPPFGRAIPAIGVEPEQPLDPVRPDGGQDSCQAENGCQNDFDPRP